MITGICGRTGVVGGSGFRIAWSAQRRLHHMVVVTFVVAWTIVTSLSASGQTIDDAKSDHILTTVDNWPVHVTYFKSDKGKEAAVVVLLTAANGDVDSGPTRRVWTELATHLQKNGFAVLSVDLRKHGDSKPEQDLGKRQKKVLPRDYRNMVIGDMEAVKAFLMEQHHLQELNIRKMGIITDGASALVGAAFALNDWLRPPYQDARKLADRTPRGQDVRAIVMFSPRSTRGFNHTKILRPLSDPRRAIAFRIYHSSEDATEQKYAEKLFTVVDLKGEDDSELRSTRSAPANGAGFLKGRVGTVVQEDLKKFLNKRLTELPTPWKSRTSALDR
ncbi:MAG: alpha/beta hydrolase [Fuerstiella sp.]|nr:alpha/beta hydrolase [Fuerstiella sp.]